MLKALNYLNNVNQSKHQILILGVLFACLLCLAFPLMAQENEHNTTVRILTQFERLYTDNQNTPPLQNFSTWQQVKLKDIWPIEVRKQYQEAWYRTSFELQELPDQPWSILVHRVSALASFWVNGVEVGRSSKMTNKLPNAWNKPVLITFPSNVLKPGQNTIDIKLTVSDSIMGVLYEVYVGPESELGPIHSRAYFAKVTASQILTFIMMLVSALTLVIYFKGNQPKSYFWFFLGSVCWTIYSVGLYVENIPLPDLVWQSLSRLSLLASVIFYSLSVHRMLNYRRKKFEFALSLLFIFVLVLTFLFPAIEISRLDNFTWLACILLVSIIGLTLTWSGWKRRNEQQLWLMVAGATIIFLAWYDMYMAINQITALFAKFPYIPVVAVVIGGIAFFTRFLRTDQAFKQLQTDFVEQKQRAASEAVVEERSRLMREIHDGVGGQLVSALSMLENKEVRNSQVVRSLRTSLDDLRTIINSLETMGQEGNIVTLLATMRERIERQLQPHEIALEWAVNPLPQLDNFGSEQSLQVMRIIQEAITNVLKHSRATRVRVTSDVCAYNRFNPQSKKRKEEGVLIEVSNNGLTQVLSTHSSGVGLSNMSHRAEVLGGEFAFNKDDVKNDAYNKETAEATAQLWIPIHSARKPTHQESSNT